MKQADGELGAGTLARQLQGPRSRACRERYRRPCWHRSTADAKTGSRRAGTAPEGRIARALIADSHLSRIIKSYPQFALFVRYFCTFSLTERA